MSSRTDSVLEFDQIRTILANYAVTEYGQQRLGSLSPTLEESKVLAALRDTSDARKVIDTVGNPPLTAMKELRPMLTIAEKGGMLLPEQLERIQQFISSCRRMKTYLKKAEAADAVSYTHLDVYKRQPQYDDLETIIASAWNFHRKR